MGNMYVMSVRTCMSFALSACASGCGSDRRDNPDLILGKELRVVVVIQVHDCSCN